MPSSNKRGKGPTQRQLRAAELVRHALVEILAREDLRDPDLKGVSITIGEVRASPDLSHMTAFVAPLGARLNPAKNGATKEAEKLATALNRCSSFLRGKLGKAVDLRITPHLNFIADGSYDEAGHIAELLNRPEVRRDLDRAADRAKEEKS
jgi:ribosome-binding factor A